MTEIQLPVSPATCTVLGYRIGKRNAVLWTGLYLDRAKSRTQSTLMLMICGPDAPYDLHLRVPWKHPTDDGEPDCWYRVRSKWNRGDLYKGKKVAGVKFKRREGQWLLCLSVEKISVPISVPETTEKSVGIRKST